MKKFSLDREKKNRALKLAGMTALALTILGAYALICVFTSFRVKCIFHKYTGLLCAGCGITRSLLSLLRFDIVSAIKYNQLVFLYIAYVGLVYVRSGLKYIRTGERELVAPPAAVNVIMVAAMAIFFVLRNFL